MNKPAMQILSVRLRKTRIAEMNAGRVISHEDIVKEFLPARRTKHAEK